jgi:5-methylcytosine-specific restriction endonuclease McrA
MGYKPKTPQQGRLPGRKNRAIIDGKLLCIGCGERLLLGNFYKSGRKGNGAVAYQMRCIPCHKEYISRKRKECTQEQQNYWAASSANTSAKKHHAPGRLGVNDWRDLLRRSNYTCKYCGQIGGLLTLDHVIPISEYKRGDLRATNTVSNIVVACKMCNFAKSNLSIGEFIDWLNRVRKAEGPILIFSFMPTGV